MVKTGNCIRFYLLNRGRTVGKEVSGLYREHRPFLFIFLLITKEENMTKETQDRSLSSDNLDTSSVLEGAEPWDKAETQLVVGSFVAACIALVIGLLVVPTSVIY